MKAFFRNKCQKCCFPFALSSPFRLQGLRAQYLVSTNALAMETAWGSLVVACAGATWDMSAPTALTRTSARMTVTTTAPASSRATKSAILSPWASAFAAKASAAARARPRLSSRRMSPRAWHSMAAGPIAAATAVAHAAPPAKSTRPAECGSMTSAVTQRKTLCSQRKCA